MRRALAFFTTTLLVAVCACKKKEAEPERGAAPPPVASSKPGACASGGGTASDPVSGAFFARTAGNYCIDPNGETRSYGENAAGSLDKVCTELFDGECEVYKSFGLKRVVTLRYIDGQGSPGAINVNLSRFADKGSAYGFFTKRVVADADPLQTTTSPLDAGGASALGTGIAYVWRGDYVAELSYTNDIESPDEIKQSSRTALPPLARELGEKLPGDKSLPDAASLLPTDHRIKLGVTYEPKDVLDIGGTGAGALGYYKRGEKRWRVLSIVRPDEESAKDVLKTLRKVDGAKTLKGPINDALTFSLKEDDSSPKLTWVVARKGSSLLGIGDEEFATGSGPGEGPNPQALGESEKIEELQRLLSTAKSGGAPPAPAGNTQAGSPRP